MKTIWKFELRTNCEQKARMPQGAQLLCVEFQGDQFCLWALVDPDEPLEDRTFCVCETGGMVDDEFKKYVGTAQTQLPRGPYVAHVFERTSP